MTPTAHARLDALTVTREILAEQLRRRPFGPSAVHLAGQIRRIDRDIREIEHEQERWRTAS